MSYPNQATAVLQKLAMRYGTHPACLGWGLLNEPVSPVPGSASSPYIVCLSTPQSPPSASRVCTASVNPTASFQAADGNARPRQHEHATTPCTKAAFLPVSALEILRNACRAEINVALQSEHMLCSSVAEPVAPVTTQAGTLTDQQLFSYFNQTYFAIRLYSPDTFIMVSPLIYEVRPELASAAAGLACLLLCMRQGTSNMLLGENLQCMQTLG